MIDFCTASQYSVLSTQIASSQPFVTALTSRIGFCATIQMTFGAEEEDHVTTRTMIDCETAAGNWLERRFDCRPSEGATFEAVVRERFAADPAMLHMADVVHGAIFPEDLSTAESLGLRLCLGAVEDLELDSAAVFDHTCFIFDALLASANAKIAAQEPVSTDPLLEPVSGLPNSFLFHDRLAQAIANAHRRDSELALCKEPDTQKQRDLHGERN